MATLPPRTVVLRRNPKNLRILWLPVVLVLLGLVTAVTGVMWSGLTNVATGLVLFVTLGARAWATNEEPVEEEVPLELDGRELVIDDERFAIDRIGAGYLLGGGRVRMHFAERRLSTDLRFASPEAAEAFLEAIHLGPRQRVATFSAVASTPSSPLGWFLRLSPIFLGTILYVASGLNAIWLPVMLLVMMLSLWRRNVHVGSDGLRIERGFLWSRFVPHAAIEGLHILERKRRRDGVNVVVETDEDEHRVGFRSREEARAFVSRVEAAAAEALARGGDEPAAWVARLRASTQLGSPRRGAVTDGQLWRIVEGTRLRPVDRAAAAIALGPSLDEHARARVLDVAAATASPRLRVVLDAAVGGEDDEALAEALAELIEEDGARVPPKPLD